MRQLHIYFFCISFLAHLTQGIAQNENIEKQTMLMTCESGNPSTFGSVCKSDIVLLHEVTEETYRMASEPFRRSCGAMLHSASPSRIRGWLMSRSNTLQGKSLVEFIWKYYVDLTK